MKLLFLCIGSEKISGDCIGPIVGTLLKEKYRIPYPVLGTEDNSVNGANIRAYRDNIKKYFPDYKIIAVDSAVGDDKDLWTLKIREGGVRAGGALNPSVEYYGNVLDNLLSAPYSKIVDFAERIAKTIVKAFAPERLKA